MALRLTAEYVNGALKPLEPLDLQEGAVVTLYIEEEGQSKQQESILDMTDRLRQSAPADVWDKMPTDSAKNYRHYLYGHPKEEE